MDILYKKKKKLIYRREMKNARGFFSFSYKKAIMDNSNIYDLVPTR